MQVSGPPPEPISDGSSLIYHKHIIQQWMHDRSNLPIQRDFVGVAREVKGSIVGAFGYDNFQERGCQQHLSVDTPGALNRELCRAAFRIPFEQWNYQYLAAIIPASNHKSINMAHRLGYQEVGTIPRELWYGVLYRENCKWLTEKRRDE